MAKRLTVCAMLSALAIILGYIEQLFPLPFAMPGMKLGLANIAVLAAIYLFGAGAGFCVLVVKVLASNLLFGGFAGFLYSLCGAVLSFVAMLGAKRIRIFSIAGVSIAGGVFHNLGQLAVAAFLVGSLKVFYYLPWLLISGMVFGTVTAIAGKLIVDRISSAPLR